MTRFTRRAPLRGAARSGNTLRPVEWIRDCESNVPLVTSGGPLGIVIVEAAEFDDFTRPTVVRIRGSFQARISDVTSGNQAELVYGITIVNPGEPSPDPDAERRGNRWLYWGCMHLINPPGASLQLVDNISSRWEEFDVKAMRKRMVDGSTLQFVFTSAGPADQLAISVGASVLIKE